MASLLGRERGHWILFPVLPVLLMAWVIARSKGQGHIARTYSSKTPSKCHLAWTDVEAAGRGQRSATPDGPSS